MNAPGSVSASVNAGNVTGRCNVRALVRGGERINYSNPWKVEGPVSAVRYSWTQSLLRAGALGCCLRQLIDIVHSLRAIQHRDPVLHLLAMREQRLVALLISIAGRS